MGFISSVARCVRDNKLSRRLSTNNKPQRLEDDYNDLIKISSNTISLARAESMASASTAVHHSAHEPTFPTADSPIQHQQMTPAQLNLSIQMQNLFDNGQLLDDANNRAARALSRPEYPILKLDTVQSPFDTPPRKLQAPLETGEKMVLDESKYFKNGYLKRQREEKSSDNVGVEKESGKKGSKLRRSMTGLFRKTYSFKLPRSPVSMKTLRPPASPRWIDVDASSLADKECLVSEKDEEKWLEAHGIGGGRDIGIWTSEGVGRT
ncbi:hypothetical protein N7509_006233 [Penicillium cosmopolitanum]|uniref:Uncharacterized protein n=1 Tax=Penicillium cosmopolitanum TaxID=1131564 RepID=A0A9W9W3T0_9EURO|nr:uncharacterized protein N7509_006233 [Penicillium cosmopolitanum]KAJ5398120.1 hypothetical protein N7509_006233 [Penicillium cosmopolitanum]